MKIAITGATGFIGNRLMLAHFDAGDEVTILTRKKVLEKNLASNVTIVNADLLGDASDLKRFTDGVEILYHCAAEIRDEKAMYAVNVQGTKNLIDAVSNPKMRWVQLSSVGVYGPRFDGEIDEECDCLPANTYEKTKLISDQLVIEAGLKKTFSFSLLRPSNVYGAHMVNPSLYSLIKAVRQSLFFFIGPKGASANYIAVENVVKALMLCGRSPKAASGIYNLSDWTTMEDFIDVISLALNKNPPSLRMPIFMARKIAYCSKFIPGFPLSQSKVTALTNRSRYPTTLIESELGYRHEVSIHEGIEKFTRLKGGRS